MALVAKNVGFYYKKNHWLFRNINFKLSPGEIVGISGYSGCGKTSFGKILANYLEAIEGSILIDEEVVKKNVFQPVQLIYQHPEKALNPKWRMKASLNESYEPSKEILERFGIKQEWLNRFPIEISGGEMQRFCIVRALNPATKYIIADEMTTMLDAVTQAKIWRELIHICKEREIGLVVISHEPELLAKLCDRIVSIEEIQCRTHEEIHCTTYEQNAV